MVFIVFGYRFLSQFFLFISSLKMGNQPALKDDLIPPSPPQLFLPFEATNSAQVKLTGSTEPEITVYVSLNKTSVGIVTANENGDFEQNLQLNEGQNTITAVAIDMSGNKSQPSIPISVDFRSAMPKLEVITPKDGQQFSGTNNRVEIKGKTDPENRIMINDRVVIVSSGGNFSFTAGLVSGENSFIIRAVDRAGNQKQQELKVIYQRE